MKCVIPATKIKRFGKCIQVCMYVYMYVFMYPCVFIHSFVRLIVFLSGQALAKIGDEIMLETTSNKFVLRTLGKGEASYCEIRLDIKGFFDQYMFTYENKNITKEFSINTGDNISVMSHNARAFRCKIPGKVLLAAFRIITGINSLVLSISPENRKLSIELIGSKNVKRKYVFMIEEVPHISEADFDSEETTQELTSNVDLFKKFLNNFPKALDEITIQINKNYLTLTSYHDPNSTTNVNDTILTKCHIASNEFSVYNINLPQELKKMSFTVCQNEFRAFLNFLDAIDAPLNLFANFGGKPVMLCNAKTGPNGGYRDIRSRLIMATLSDDPEIQLNRSQTISISPQNMLNQSKSRSILPPNNMNRSQESKRNSNSNDINIHDVDMKMNDDINNDANSMYTLDSNNNLVTRSSRKKKGRSSLAVTNNNNNYNDNNNINNNSIDNIIPQELYDQQNKSPYPSQTSIMNQERSYCHGNSNNNINNSYDDDNDVLIDMPVGMEPPNQTLPTINPSSPTPNPASPTQLVSTARSKRTNKSRNNNHHVYYVFYYLSIAMYT